MEGETVLGIISDTHGKLDSRVAGIFNGVDYILHAGDIGNKGSVISGLEAIAPLYVVRGNCDVGYKTRQFPYELEIIIADVAIYMTHAYQCIDLVKAHKAQLVIFGHNHYPEIKEVRNTKYLNPGSASQGRKQYPCSVALVRLTPVDINIDIVNL